jgi:hypothetical protein
MGFRSAPLYQIPGCHNIHTELQNAIKDEIIPAITILCNEVGEKVKWQWNKQDSGKGAGQGTTLLT